MSPRALVTIVTYNSATDLQSCLDSLKNQTFRDFTISIWDNASHDETQAVILRNQADVNSMHFSKDNVGFCTAHNRLITASDAEYILVLNPDVILDNRFLEILLSEMDRHPDAGSATGKLLRMPDPSQAPGTQQNILDSTGMYFTPNQRHFDRGSNEVDSGQYEKTEYVFGASGAAAFFRKSMLQDIGDGDRYFDEHFFAYREDADLAWRAQWMGWRCLYIPEAKGYHVRRVLPERRSTLPEAINMHSFKNRFLMRIKNMDAGTYARFFFPITVRDIAILVYVLLFERSSLHGIPLIIRAFPDAWAMRKRLKACRRVSPKEIRKWFKTKEPGARSQHCPSDRDRNK